MTRFWLIRHALVHPDALTCLYGTQDVAICEVTMAADVHRYRALANRLPRPAMWYVTPLSRTHLTAEAIFDAGYPEQNAAIEPAFIEQDFGEWQGVPMQDFSARLGVSRHPFWPIAAAERPPHGGAIRAACAHAIGLDPHQALSLAVDNISLSRLEHNGSGWRLVSLNEQLST